MLDPGPTQKKKDDNFAIKVYNQSFKQKSSFWGWGLWCCMMLGSFTSGMGTGGLPRGQVLGSHAGWGPGCCHLLSLSLVLCSPTWPLPAWESTSIQPLGAPRLCSSGMLVGISWAMLPKPITCVSIVLIVAFKIIAGWRQGTGRALWICTGAWAHHCVWYRRFAV